MSGASCHTILDLPRRWHIDCLSHAVLDEGAPRGVDSGFGRRATSKFLAKARKTLSVATDHEECLTRLAELVVQELADWCAIEVAEANGWVRRVAAVHSDQRLSAVNALLESRYLLDEEAEHGTARALRTGAPELIDSFGAVIDRLGLGNEDQIVFTKLGLGSTIFIPLIARARVIGSMTIALSRTSRRFSEHDLPFAEDVAARAALVADSGNLIREATEATRTKHEFLATISHELRTPLNAILGWSHLLRAGRLDDETLARALETIERNARSEARLVEEMLDVSRIVTGRSKIDLVPVELSRVLEASLDALRPVAEARRIELDLLIDHGAEHVSGDAARLQQLMWHLVSNAIKFTPAGGAVTVLLEPYGSDAVIVVRDTGEGIAPGFLPHVFDPFRQADSSSTRKHGGLGMGLTIVRHLVELHGGSVRADSAGEGRGSAFTVRLPLLSQKLAGPRSPGFEPGMLRGLRVIVVHPDRETSSTIATVVGLCGAEVKSAPSMELARGIHAEWHADVLLSEARDLLQSCLSMEDAPPATVAIAGAIEPVELVAAISRVVARAA